MATEIHRIVESAEQGTLERFVCHMSSGVLALGDPQIMPGYCVLYANPVVPHLNALDPESRSKFLMDMALVGDVLLQITDAARINYEILGNKEPALHAHIIPRYAAETEEMRTKPVWLMNWDYAQKFDASLHGQLIAVLAERLKTEQ